MQDWKQKRNNLQHYDLQAAIYDKQYVDEQNNKIKMILESLDLSSNDIILDLGCGTGFLFENVANNAKVIVGSDVSKKALLCAKKRTKKLLNVNLVCADADNAPFMDNYFDKIFAVTVLQNMPEPTKTLQEMKRIGKHRALFAVTGLKKSFSKESFVELLENAKIKIILFNDKEALKDYIAVCGIL